MTYCDIKELFQIIQHIERELTVSRLEIRDKYADFWRPDDHFAVAVLIAY